MTPLPVLGIEDPLLRKHPESDLPQTVTRGPGLLEGQTESSRVVFLTHPQETGCPRNRKPKTSEKRFTQFVSSIGGPFEEKLSQLVNSVTFFHLESASGAHLSPGWSHHWFHLNSCRSYQAQIVVILKAPVLPCSSLDQALTTQTK